MATTSPTSHELRGEDTLVELEFDQITIQSATSRVINRLRTCIDIETAFTLRKYIPNKIDSAQQKYWKDEVI